jgi:acyl-CoA thioester hydrolase
VERYSKTYTVRWADCDANGHMRNTGYIDLGIEVRMAFLDEHGVGLAEMKRHGFGPVVLREEIDYRRECHMGDQITIDFTALGLTKDGTRFKVAHQVLRGDGKVAANLVVLGGWMDLKARKLAPPPDAIKAALEHVPRADGFEWIERRPRRTPGDPAAD